MISRYATSNILVNSNRFTAFLLAAFFIAGLSAGGELSVSPSAASDLRVELLPIEIDTRDPKRVEFDRLKLLGAFQLSSKNSRFGGLSGLAIGADGKLCAVSDRGFWLSARMHLDSHGRLLNLADWDIAPLLTPEKKPVNKLLADAEALALAIVPAP